MSYNKEEFSSRLAELRTSKGYTQSDVEEKTGVSAKMLSKYETGASSPDIDTVVKLSECYEISLDYLLNNKKEEESRKTEGLSVSDSAEWLFRKQFENFMAVYNNTSDNLIETPQVPECLYNDITKWGESCRSDIKRNSLFALMVSSDDLNLSITRLPNKNNCSWTKDSGKISKITKLMDLLSKQETISILTAIHTEGFPICFTAKYLSDIAGVETGAAGEILNTMTEMNFFISETAHIGRDGTNEIYTFYGDAYLFTLLEMAHDLLYGEQRYALSYSDNYRPIALNSRLHKNEEDMK